MSAFDQWLPMYRASVVPTRPWWWLVITPDSFQSYYTRPDGAKVRAVDHDGLVYTRLSSGTIDGRLATHDAAHPLPAPPLMAGQVWVHVPTGDQHIMGPYVPRAWNENLNPERFLIGDGALSECVLVAGPTPWGRDVPWAPPGWKP